MNKQKFYYIGDLSKLIEVPPHILRYWEKEFSHLKPLRDKMGNRIYTQKDISQIEDIKFLIYNKGYSIKGAKQELRTEKPKQRLKSNKNFLKILLREVKELKKCLK